MHSNDQENQFASLRDVMPEAGKIDESLRGDLYGMVRQYIIHEQEEENEAVNIYRDENLPTLKQAIDRIPFHENDEVHQKIQELNLSQQEAEMEMSHWAFNHQTLKGELLIENDLFSFKLTRLFQYTYILICNDYLPKVAETFNRAFAKSFDVFSDKALFVGKDHWSGWAWFVDPDEQKNQEAINRIKEIWKKLD